MPLSKNILRFGRLSIFSGLFFFAACNETGGAGSNKKPGEEEGSGTTQSHPTQIGTGGETGSKGGAPDPEGDRGLVPQQPAELVLSPATFDFGIQSISSQ